MNGNGEHIGGDELADDSFGLLSPTRHAAIVAHLADCVECRDRLAALQRVAAELASAPPEPMPSDIVARIETAIQAERGASPTVVPLAPVGRRRPNRLVGSLAGLAVAAAAAALVFVVVTSHHSNGSRSAEAVGPSSFVSSGPTADELTQLQQVEHVSGTHYTQTSTASKVFKQLQLSGQAEAPMSRSNGVLSTPQTSAPATSSGPVPQVFGGKNKTPTAEPPKALRPLQSPQRLYSCLAQLDSGSGVPVVLPVSVDYATYHSATYNGPVLVVTTPEDAADDETLIVAPNCGTPAFESAQIQVLLFQQVAKP